MTGVKSLDKFLDLFNSNAGGVISTITNQQLTFSQKSYGDFNFATLETNLTVPCVIATINFSGANELALHLITSKKVTASLADLMMLGTGEAEYSPEENNDSLKEMFNQALGSMSTEMTGEGVTATGTVAEVELSDMSIQKDFMVGNKMVEIAFTLLGKEQYFYMIIDADNLKTIDAMFAPPATKSSGGAKQQQGPVSASRASFAEIEEVSPSIKNINLDNLLDIPLPVSVELGRKEMRIKDILDLGQGAIVELTKLAGDLVDLYINGKKFAVGEVMVVDENYAVRIVNLISREERIRTLGPE
jgi:flagellar motor switch protein FliN/FliY